MNLYVEHDAAMLARLGGVDRPACDSVIVKHGDASSVLGSTRLDNPLSDHWLIDVDAPGQRIVTWSGTLAPELFERDPRTWGKPGKQAFARLCDEMAGQIQTHNRTLCIHPHARHVLNDVPSCLTFLRERVGQPFEIALAPASLLEPSMLDSLEEHLQRQFEGLGDRCSMVLLSDVRVVDDADGEPRCEATPLGQGVFSRELIRNLLRDSTPAATPIVIDGRGGGSTIQHQIEWLTG